MSGYYSIEDIRKHITNEIEMSNVLRDEWAAVTFPTKKDGSAFTVMSKNISGATIRTPDYGAQSAYEKELSVYACSKCSGYVGDKIQLYELVTYLKDPGKKEKAWNYAPKQTHLEQVYMYDLDDIKQAVADRVSYYENRIASLEKQLAKLNSAYNSFKDAYEKALETLETACGIAENTDKQKNDIYYAILETVKDRYPYC